MNVENSVEIKTQRIVVTIELDVVTFPSGSQWVTDIDHTDKINEAIKDAKHELLGDGSHDDLVTQKDIESLARQNLADDELHGGTFKRVKDKQLFSALRSMLGVNSAINAATKLNPFAGA